MELLMAATGVTTDTYGGHHDEHDQPVVPRKGHGNHEGEGGQDKLRGIPRLQVPPAIKQREVHAAADLPGER